MFAASLPQSNNQLATALGCAVDQMGFVTVDSAGRTNVENIWAGGDLTSMRHQMSIAIAQGTAAGADCAGALILGSG